MQINSYISITSQQDFKQQERKKTTEIKDIPQQKIPEKIDLDKLAEKIAESLFPEKF